jgi:hypothetical protein
MKSFQPSLVPREEDTEQVVGGNGGQALSFASLCQSCAAVPPHLTFYKK